MSKWVRAAIVALAIAAPACGGGTAPLAAGEYRTLTGTTASLTAFYGKPTIVNFFASWCTPCRLEMPDFERVHATFGDRVNFLGLNVQEDASRAQSVVADTKVTYSIGLDPQGAIFRKFKAVTMPSTALLDAQGQLVDVHPGALTAADLTQAVREKLGVA